MSELERFVKSVQEHENIKENFKMIILIVIVVLLLLVIINIKGIDLNEPKPESKLVQEVTVETFEQNSMQDSQANIEFDNSIIFQNTNLTIEICAITSSIILDF